MGSIFDRAEQRAHEIEARRRRWAVLERAARLHALGAAAAIAVLAWWLSGWVTWPWLVGLGVLVVAALLGLCRRLAPAQLLTLALLAVDVVLLTQVRVWWWAVLVGSALTAAAVLAAVRLRFRTRRWQIVTALVVGPVLLATGVVMLAVEASERDVAAQVALDQAHDEAIARTLPRTPNALVHDLAQSVATGGTTRICVAFAPAAAAQFAAAHHAPDCLGAVRALGAQVTDARRYQADLWIPAQAVQYVDRTTTVVDACQLDWSSIFGDTPHPGPPGPQLGRFTLTQQYGSGQRVTGYRPCSLGT
ncbi:hypothetical protein [Amycolatopsis sp. NPDC058986]|uniref:hypothetical protein n=1 Tax=unclassified Amycolatopsis TaxID=2618356 RepID=UPI00366D0CF7